MCSISGPFGQKGRGQDLALPFGRCFLTYKRVSWNPPSSSVLKNLDQPLHNVSRITYQMLNSKAILSVASGLGLHRDTGRCSCTQLNTDKSRLSPQCHVYCKDSAMLNKTWPVLCRWSETHTSGLTIKGFGCLSWLLKVIYEKNGTPVSDNHTIKNLTLRQRDQNARRVFVSIVGGDWQSSMKRWLPV